jgi:GNAT superfamily N-acetyltransferase
VRFRPALKEDAPAVSALIHSLSHFIAASPHAVGSDRFFHSVSPESEQRYISDPRYYYLCAFSDSDLLGFVALRDNTHLFHLFVAERLHRTGLASTLWRQAREHSQSLGNSQGFTVNSSIGAVPVYARFGFAVVGPKIRAHGIDFVPMQLLLNPHGA